MDIGTGDGRFVYQMCQKNPEKFYIGIDPAQEPLQKISEKIYRKKNMEESITPSSSRLRSRTFQMN